MEQFRSLYRLSFFGIVFIIFLGGGVMQFLFGLSNTVITFLLVVFMFAVYLFYANFRAQVLWTSILRYSLLLSVWIVLVGLIRGSHPVSIATYLIFPLLPLSVHGFFFINYKEGFLTEREICRFFFLIAILQFPVLLIQKNFYDQLIVLNNSGQIIEWFDFMFGTFFIKSDHSLGAFLLLMVGLLLIKNQLFSFSKQERWIWVGYLSLTLFLTESNISKLFLIVLLSSYLVIPLYKKLKSSVLFRVVALVFVLGIAYIGYSIKDEQIIKDRLGGSFEKQTSLATAEKYYDLGTAKRFQIIIVAYNKIPTKWIGDGPYSYFDIRTGKFKQTMHFTQLIWSYYDLGLVGLFLVGLYLIHLLKFLNIPRGIPFLFFGGIFFFYSLYTTVLSDIAIFFALFAMFNKKSLVESYRGYTLVKPKAKLP